MSWCLTIWREEPGDWCLEDRRDAERTGDATEPLHLHRSSYSRMNVAANQPRAQFKDPANATPQEKVAAYDTFTANTGTYQISGDSIVFDVMLAKVPNNL